MSLAAIKRLTDREGEVLALVAEGHSNRAIAQELCATERTVETHISRIFAKLDLQDSPVIHRRVRAALIHQAARPLVLTST